MKTKIVYTLVSDIKDHYLEQLILSLYTLREHNPEVKVEVVCDEDTYKSIKGGRAKIKDFNITLIPVDVPHFENKAQKSRFLKTTLRKRVKGDYLYIDTDTLIVGDLSDIDKAKADMACVTDCNRKKIVDCEKEKCLKLGYDEIIDKPFYNAGVCFVKDNEKTHLFYDNWNQLWKQCLEKGYHYDQPSFNKTINSNIANVIKLDDKWNYQLHCAPYVSKPKILHYFGTGFSQSFWEIFKEPLNNNPTPILLNRIASLLICHQSLTNTKRFNDFYLSETGWSAFNAPNVYKRLGWFNNLIIGLILKLHRFIKS